MLGQVVDLLVLRLQTCPHLLSPMRENMLRLPEILDLELVLIQVSGPLLQFLNHLLVLQFQQLDLLCLLFEQLDHVLPLLLNRFVQLFSCVPFAF